MPEEKPTPGWKALIAATLPAVVTVKDLMAATGLSRRTVGERLTSWVTGGLLEPAGFGPHGALSYPATRVRELAAGLPGSGNRTTGEVRRRSALVAVRTRRERMVRDAP